MSSSSIFSSAGDHHSFSGFLDNIIVDFPSQNQELWSSGSDNSTQKTNSPSNSGSHDSDQTNRWDVNVVEERKRKRLVSNRESAKRSRERKRKKLEKLRNQIIEYETGNRELMSRLGFVNLNGQMVRRENERLWLESEMQLQKLYKLRQLLLLLHELNLPLLSSTWPCNNNNNLTTAKEQINQPSLTTTFKSIY